MINKKIHPTSANYPGFFVLDAILKTFENQKSLHLDKSKIQLCPQQMGQITPFLAEKLKNKYPSTKFQLHANTWLLKTPYIFDASSDLNLEMNCEYINNLKLINSILKSNIYSYHAGRNTCSKEQMYSNVKNLENIIQCEVLTEGLYPTEKNTWLISSLDDYEWLANNLGFALDLSHLQIVFQYENKPMDFTWVKHMIEHPNCKEIHISTNDGIKDSHQALNGDEVWIEILNTSSTKVPIFTEEIFQMPTRKQPQHKIKSEY